LQAHPQWSTKSTALAKLGSFSPPSSHVQNYPNMPITVANGTKTIPHTVSYVAAQAGHIDNSHQLHGYVQHSWQGQVHTPARGAIGAERAAGASFAGWATNGMPDKARLCVLALAASERSICTLLDIIMAAMLQLSACA
jgi:hypothetical protein